MDINVSNEEQDLKKKKVKNIRKFAGMLLLATATLVIQRVPENIKAARVIESTIEFFDNTDQETRDYEYLNGNSIGIQDGYKASIKSDGENLTTEFKYDIDGESTYFKKGYIAGYKEGYAKAVLERSNAEGVLYVGIKNNDDNVQYAPVDSLSVIYSNTVNQNSIGSNYSIVKDYNNEYMIEKDSYIDLITNNKVMSGTVVSSSVKVKDYILEKQNENSSLSNSTNEYVKTFDSNMFMNELDLEQSFVK